MSNRPYADWPVAALLADLASAQVITGLLELEGVPTHLVVGNPLLGQLHGCEIYVPPELLHRARWMLASAPLSDAELTFLATGELDGGEKIEK
jgi:hypothetical protein